MQRYLVLSRGDFEVFRPAGTTRCTGVLGVGAQKRKILPKFLTKFEEQ